MWNQSPHTARRLLQPTTRNCVCVQASYYGSEMYAVLAESAADARQLVEQVRRERRGQRSWLLSKNICRSSTHSAAGENSSRWQVLLLQQQEQQDDDVMHQHHQCRWVMALQLTTITHTHAKAAGASALLPMQDPLHSKGIRKFELMSWVQKTD